jgi:glutathione peroxidase-family protein
MLICYSLGMSSFYEIEANLITGEIFAFSQLRGKVCLIVNVASF